MVISFHRWAAKRGARLMDRERPGWARRINRVTLNLQTRYDCVLGQEYGGYSIGLAHLGFGRFRAISYGFCLSAGHWDSLTAAWQAEIRARRPAPVPVRGRRVHDLAA
jgi:hypothetical protein